MDMKDILEDMKKDLERAKKDMDTAKDLIAMGEEMGLDVSKRRADIRAMQMQIDRFETVVNKRMNKQK